MRTNNEHSVTYHDVTRAYTDILISQNLVGDGYRAEFTFAVCGDVPRMVIMYEDIHIAEIEIYRGVDQQSGIVYTSEQQNVLDTLVDYYGVGHEAQ